MTQEESSIQSSRTVSASAAWWAALGLEETDWDQNLRRVTNGTLAEYLVPVNADIHELDALPIVIRQCESIYNYRRLPFRSTIQITIMRSIAIANRTSVDIISTHRRH
jgi:hypothetical protein